MSLNISPVRFGAQQFQSPKISAQFVAPDSTEPEETKAAANNATWSQMIELFKAVQQLFDTSKATDTAEDSQPATVAAGLKLQVGGEEKATAKTIKEARPNLVAVIKETAMLFLKKIWNLIVNQDSSSTKWSKAMEIVDNLNPLKGSIPPATVSTPASPTEQANPEATGDTSSTEPSSEKPAA